MRINHKAEPRDDYRVSQHKRWGLCARCGRDITGRYVKNVMTWRHNPKNPTYVNLDDYR